MFFDLHCHTSGISRCCKLPYNIILDLAKEYGYDGIVLTNHYTGFDLDEFGEDTFVEKYINEFNSAKEYASKIGLKIFFGAEITVDYNIDVHLVIYGVTPEFLRNHKNLPRLSQADLYKICQENGCALVNAHPFRNGTSVQDLRYLDGLEVNCHFRFGDCHEGELSQLAIQNHKALTCGCDFHGDSDKPCGGIYLPDKIHTNQDLVEYIKKGEKFHIKVHDPVTRLIYEKEVVITR